MKPVAIPNAAHRDQPSADERWFTECVRYAALRRAEAEASLRLHHDGLVQTGQGDDVVVDDGSGDQGSGPVLIAIVVASAGMTFVVATLLVAKFCGGVL